MSAAEFSRSLMRRILERLPLALFLLALAAALIGYGIAIERHEVFPHSILEAAAKTLRTTAANLDGEDTARLRAFSDAPLDDFPARRIEITEGDSLADAVLVSGGRHQFRDLCPEHGCLAVAVAVDGTNAHAWPWRPDAILAANVADEGGYPRELNAFSFERDTRLSRIAQYSNGDLLVTFRLENAFPYAGGVARIDRDGHPRWFRRDYSHHQPYVTEDDIAIVPTLTVGDDDIEARNGGRAFSLPCDGKVYRTALNVLDGDGNVLEHVPVLDILLASPWSGVLAATLNPCDPLHLNSIDIVGTNAGGAPHGIRPGDIVLSFRQISAFAILDGETREMKSLIRGSFFRQHAVTHLGGSLFLMFDNQGIERTIGASRLLMIDLATGAETTIFPNERTPEALRGLYSAAEGVIDISPDRQRATVAFTRDGVAVEVRLADGEVLAVFRSLHDVSDLEQFPKERLELAAGFDLLGVYYLRDGAPMARQGWGHPVREE